jgi:hypothetical protein
LECIHKKVGRYRVLAVGIGGGHGDFLEVLHVPRELPRDLTRVADATLGIRSDNDLEGAGEGCQRRNIMAGDYKSDG